MELIRGEPLKLILCPVCERRKPPYGRGCGICRDCFEMLASRQMREVNRRLPRKKALPDDWN